MPQKRTSLEGGRGLPQGNGPNLAGCGNAVGQVEGRPLSAWQLERAALLHRACKSVQWRINHGQRKRKAFRRVSNYLNGRSFRCDPKRHLALTEGTLRRLFAKWKHGGEIPAAFKLNYHVRQPSIPAPVFVRFAEFCASQPLPSVRAAWENFCRRRGSFGRGMRARKPLKISYNQLRYNFPAADFYLMQAEIRARAVSNIKQAQLLSKIIVGIRQRLPERPPRRRIKREADFQI